MGASGPSGQSGGGSKNSNKKAKADTQVSANEAFYASQKAKAKAKSKITDGTLSDPREKDDTAAKMDLFINDPYTKKQGGPLMLRPLEPLFDAGAKKTRTFFTDKVLNSKRAKKNIGYTKDEFSKLSRNKQESIYKGYLAKRSSNTTDAYGNKLNINSGPDNQVVQTPPVATIMPVPSDPNAPAKPLDPQPSETEKKYDARKTKKKGRNQNLLTSARGVTKTAADYSLGKKSLLGQVV